MASATNNREIFHPLVAIVDFHHARGPEVEQWFGLQEGLNPLAERDWSLLPFFALPDGSHALAEELSYFTLRYQSPTSTNPTSLFGISCTRQINASELLRKSEDVTRSSVQKALVAIVDSPYHFARIREKLSAVTKAWFAQRDFEDVAIVDQFLESIIHTCEAETDDRDQYFGLSLRELIHEYKHQTLVLLKCCLLQPKMLFFGSHCEKLCMLQFSLISLIPGLLRSLQDCADPSYSSYEESIVQPSSLRTSDRSSLLAYMGLPLQLFGKGSLFGPYTPLQQLDVLDDANTKSFVAGSTNSLLLSQPERHCDIFVNIDDGLISISSPWLRSVSYLTAADRRWIDFITQTVINTWDERNPTRPSSHGYAGSEEFIRLQFEEYLLAMVSSVKYRIFVEKNGKDPKALLTETHNDPTIDFGTGWVDVWMRTHNYRILAGSTDSHLFDIVEPRHPCAGGLSMEDVQRRLTQQIADLHLDERFNSSRELIGKHLATGGKSVSTALNRVWTDIEVMRETQRKRAADAKQDSTTSSSELMFESHDGDSATEPLHTNATKSSSRTPDLAHAGTKVHEVSAKAGAYLSSWGAWAAEKGKMSFGRATSSATADGDDKISSRE